MSIRLRNLVSKKKLRFAQSLRRNPSPPQALFWHHLRNRQVLGFRFRREAILRGWIADFWCPAARLVVEVDGRQHEEPLHRARDQYRDAALRELGISTLRIPARDIFQNIQTCVAQVEQALLNTRRPKPRKVSTTDGGGEVHLRPEPGDERMRVGPGMTRQTA